MTSLELEGDHLGQKHQHYNKLLKEAIEKQGLLETQFESDGDIEHLLKIDIASRNRNVEYILETFKSLDMLYVSRAIKKSTWLITDEQYAHIINVDYLHTQLFPHMMTKAINKLMLNIRIHLKDEKRVDSFYNYEKDNNTKNAMKWLQYCSLSVIEEAVGLYNNQLPDHLIKRLCRRSLSVLNAYIKNAGFISYHTLQSTMFLMRTCTEKYLDVLETIRAHNIPRIGSKYTDIIMKVCPDRVLNNFEKYVHFVDCQTVAKHLKENDAMDFLLQHSKNSKLHYFFTYDNIKYFLHRMPREGKFECLKQIFIHENSADSHEYDSRCDSKMYSTIEAIKKTGFEAVETHYWYEFAPFDEAYHDLKKLIRTETSAIKRIAILEVLLKSAGNSSQNKQSVLQYYHDNHINEPFKFKTQFVRCFIKETNATKLDDKTWSILSRLFHSMEVYIESQKDVQIFVETIIIYNLIHGKSNPKIIEDKFEFNTLKIYINQLNNEEKEKVFEFLYNHLLTKIQGENIMKKVVALLENILTLLKDWDKNILDYPLILSKIEGLIQMKTEKKWNTNLSSLYTINKTWRKHMFEQSITLHPTDEVCLNILKHDAKLFSRYKDEVMAIICSNEAKSMVKLLTKLRVYWPHSLTNDLKNTILKCLETPSVQKSTIKGLVALLPQEQLLDVVKKYAPQKNKINWGEDDEIMINLRKQIAMNMYLARPSIPMKAILYYAKGDYLQYSVPSLSSLLHNLSRVQSALEIPKLLDGPVSLQKYGIRVAVLKLKASELKLMFTNLWICTSNPTIRAVLFKHTFEAMCAEKNYLIVQEIWNLLSLYINNMTPNESSDIYEILANVENVPHPVKEKFFMKNYIFVKNLPKALFAKWKHILTRFLHYAPELIYLLDSNFVTDVILKPIGDHFNTQKVDPKVLRVVSSFLLCARHAETQKERYEKVLCPLLNRYLSAWNDEHEGVKCVQHNFQELLRQLKAYSQLTCLDKKNVNPVNMFTDILNKLEKSLSIPDNYVMFTSWKLTVAFVRLVNQHSYTLPYVELEENDNICTIRESIQKEKNDNMWNEIFLHMAPYFGRICCEYLEEDTERYFPTVFILFGKAMRDNLEDRTNIHQFYELLKCVLQANSSVETYLLVINICNEPRRTYKPKDEKRLAEIQSLLNAHPSPQIKMHYNNMAKFEQFD